MTTSTWATSFAPQHKASRHQRDSTAMVGVRHIVCAAAITVVGLGATATRAYAASDEPTTTRVASSSSRPAIGVTADGVAHIVEFDDGRVWVRDRASGRWSERRELTMPRENGSWSLAVAR